MDNIKNIKTNYIGKEIKYYETISSTHIIAQQLAKQRQVPNGTILIADRQTNAIGTKGRNWHTGSGNNIAMTIILYPNCMIQQLEGLTYQIAQTMQKTILTLYGYILTIKKPNDLMLHQKKIGGILTQSTTRGKHVENLFISIGFNVNETNFPKEIENIATSLKKEYQIDFKTEEIICKFIELLEKEIAQLQLSTDTTI